MSEESKISQEQLEYKQGRPLNIKIADSSTKMRLFKELYPDAYISNSGGLDSTVVCAIDNLFLGGIFPKKSVPSVECPENNRVSNQLGSEFINGKINRKQAIQRDGYPFGYKALAMAVDRYHRSVKNNSVEPMLYRLYGRIKDPLYKANCRSCSHRNCKNYGTNRSICNCYIPDYKDQKKESTGIIPKKWRFLIYAPFMISDKCCDHLKKAPLKIAGKHPITGEKAVDGKDRKQQYSKSGCIQLHLNHPKCTPLGSWTEQDILEFIITYDVPYSKAYGDILQDENGKYYTTGESRTGCDICLFGIMHDLDRLDRMNNSKPNVFNSMLNGGSFVRTGIKRWKKFRPDSILIYSDLEWMPDENGYGYNYVINWVNHYLKNNNKIQTRKEVI